MAIKQFDILLERLRNDPTFKAQIQSEMSFPYQSDQAVAPAPELLNPHSDKDRLEASFDSIDNLIQSFSMEPMDEKQFSAKIVNDKSLDAIKDNFTPPMAKDDFEAPDMSEEDLDAKIQEGMDKGYMDWFNTAFTPQAMDYLTFDDVSDPVVVATKKYRDSEADKFFDKAIDQDTYDAMAKDLQLFDLNKELSDPANRRPIPNAAPLEDVGDTTPAEDLAHYEEALKVLQERKASRAKSLENARAQMAGAAWMYRKDPSMLAAIFGEKHAKDIAKAGKESQDKERADAAMEAYDRQKRIYQYALNNFEENTDPKQEKRLAQELELAKIDLLYKAKKAKMSDEYDSIVGVSSPKQETLKRIKDFLKSVNFETREKFADSYGKADKDQKANYRQKMEEAGVSEEDLGLSASKQEEENAKARVKKRTKQQNDFIKEYTGTRIAPGLFGVSAKDAQRRADIEKKAKKVGLTVTWSDDGGIIIK